MVCVLLVLLLLWLEALMAAAPPSDQLGALQWFAPPLLHVYPAPAQSFPDLRELSWRKLKKIFPGMDERPIEYHNSSKSTTISLLKTKGSLSSSSSWYFPVTSNPTNNQYEYTRNLGRAEGKVAVREDGRGEAKAHGTMGENWCQWQRVRIILLFLFLLFFFLSRIMVVWRDAERWRYLLSC